MEGLLANPRGFCAGVDRAIDIVERALEFFGPPIYVRHEVVHNRHVVERLRALGAVFVDELAEVPDGATVIFSAHGVSSALEDEATAARLTVFNATCPLVTKVHMEVQRYAREGRDVLLIGHAGHPEVEGTMGRFDAPSGGQCTSWRASPMWQALPCATPSDWPSSRRRRCRSMTLPRWWPRCGRTSRPSPTPRSEDICYATQNRQDAVKKLLEQCDVLLVVGSRTSSNSNRLREMADRVEVPGYLVDGPADLKPSGLRQARGRGHRGGLGPRTARAPGRRAAARLGWRGACGGRRARRARGVHAAARAAPRVRKTRVARRSTGSGVLLLMSRGCRRCSESRLRSCTNWIGA